MSLDRKDVRFKLDPNELEQLKVFAEADNKDIGEWVEHLVLREIDQRIIELDKAIALRERLSRLGISGKNGVTTGRGRE